MSISSAANLTESRILSLCASSRSALLRSVMSLAVPMTPVITPLSSLRGRLLYSQSTPVPLKRASNLGDSPLRVLA